MLLKYKNEEITETEAREFFSENFEEATGAAVAMRHIDSADTALTELSETEFDHHRNDEWRELWEAMQDVKDDNFVRPDQDFEF